MSTFTHNEVENHIWRLDDKVRRLENTVAQLCTELREAKQMIKNLTPTQDQPSVTLDVDTK